MGDLSPKEKKVLIGETTFVSIGIVAILVSASIVVGSIREATQANAQAITELQQSDIRTNQILLDINAKLGTIDGKLDVLLQEKYHGQTSTTRPR